jgi:phosphatidylglycerophosphate synthase
MFDTLLRRWIDPPLNAVGRTLAQAEIRADQITVIGFAIGMAAAVAVAFGAFGTALALIAINRVADGLDGAVARASQPTDRGGFLDIALDFVFYAAIPLAFAIHDPPRNALAGCVLLAAFLANGSAFLAYAAIAAKRNLPTVPGRKSITYLTGLAEGAETIAVFVALCLWPTAFPLIASVFATMCIASASARIVAGWRDFDAQPRR